MSFSSLNADLSSNRGLQQQESNADGLKMMTLEQGHNVSSGDDVSQSNSNNEINRKPVSRNTEHLGRNSSVSLLQWNSNSNKYSI